MWTRFSSSIDLCLILALFILCLKPAGIENFNELNVNVCLTRSDNNDNNNKNQPMTYKETYELLMSSQRYEHRCKVKRSAQRIAFIEVFNCVSRQESVFRTKTNLYRFLNGVT